MAGPAYVGSATDSGTSVTSLAAAPHASTAVGDLMIACVALRSQQVTPPAGWAYIGKSAAPVGETLVQVLFWKLAELGDLGVSQTFTFGSASATLGLYSITGNDPAAPFDIVSLGAYYASIANGGSITATGVTTQSDECLLLAVASFFRGNTGFTPPGGMVEQTDFGIGSASGIRQSAATESGVAAGATGDKSFVITSVSGAATAAAILIAITSAAVVGTAPVLGAITTASAVGTSVTVDVPALTADGDLLLASFMLRTNLAYVLTEPSGWTRFGDIVASPSELDVYYRIASGEPADYTWSIDITCMVHASIARITNFDTTQPVHALRTNAGATSASLTVRSISSWRPNSLYFEFALLSNAGFASPTLTAPGNGETVDFNVQVFGALLVGEVVAGAHLAVAAPSETDAQVWISTRSQPWKTCALIIGPGPEAVVAAVIGRPFVQVFIW